MLEERRGKKKRERVVFVILSCYFLSCQLFSARSVKPSPGGRFLLFKNTGLVPQGGILGSCLCAAALDSLSEGRGERGDGGEE